MKKIVLLSVYGDKNIGDAAILQSSLKIIDKSIDRLSELTIFCADPKFLTLPKLNRLKINIAQKPYGYAIRHKGHFYSEILKIFYFIEIFFFSGVYYALGKINLKFLPDAGFYSYIGIIQRADSVFSIGGGYLRTKSKYKDYFGLLLTLLPIIIAKKFKKKIIFLPMSFGNFASSIHAKLSFNAIKDSVLYIRDEISLKTLNNMSPNYTLNITTSPDLALYMNFEEANLAKKMRSKYIVMTARVWFSNRKKQAYYENSLKLLIEFLWDSFQIKTIFIPMTWNQNEDNDEEVAIRIQKKLSNRKSFEILNAKHPSEVLEILSKAYFSVCTRMHSAILSSVVKTPFICIEYEYKTSGFLKLMNLSKWNININNVTFDLLKDKVLKLKKEKNYSKIHKLLKTKHTQFKKEEDKLIEMLNKQLKTI